MTTKPRDSKRGCPIKEAARKKRWYDKNKPRQQALARQRMLELRIRRKALLYAPCKSCGELDPAVIQHHHVDETIKSHELFGGCGKSEEDWWNEAMKTIPVCANCHIKIHKDLICLLPQKLLKKQ